MVEVMGGAGLDFLYKAPLQASLLLLEAGVHWKVD